MDAIEKARPVGSQLQEVERTRSRLQARRAKKESESEAPRQRILELQREVNIADEEIQSIKEKLEALNLERIRLSVKGIEGLSGGSS